ncbi:MAG: alpha-L-fucosidase [Kiritimatiellae bacterium]|nr:alpha-L-fucosidase [Kiritimatiellia bacterium]
MKFVKVLVFLPMMVCAAPPAPYGPLPSERQLKWHEMELFGLVHFGLNTMTDKEWGYGDADPARFNPARLDAGRVMEALKEGGLRGVILVAKHHDGFCLWPTRTTAYNITQSPWRGGKGDLVREYADAARKYGLRFGVYCSPWDRNSGAYGTSDYLPLYQAQITELLSNYGTICEMWFDGANGGDGYYGGAKETRKIDRFAYYDWPATWGIVRKLQPNACIFGDVGPDCRWVGNENGYAAQESWATFTPRGRSDPARPANGDSRTEEAPAGHRDGKFWIPPECDVPLRRGWFWHADQDATVRPPAKLMEIYFASVGRGGGMNLGIAPDRDGLVCDADRASLKVFGNALRSLFANNFAAGARAEADAVRAAPTPEEAARYAPGNVLDGDRYTYWATDDGVTEAALTLKLVEVAEFDVVRLRENIKLGQRVDAFVVEVWDGKAWQLFAQGESIGACRLLRGKKIRTDRVRLRILHATACPCISEFGLYAMPVNL